MIPTNFAESNATLAPPEGMTEDECGTLFIHRGNDGRYPVVVTCWKLTPSDLLAIQQTGRIWLVCVGRTMPPVQLTGESPFPRRTATGDGASGVAS